MSTVPVSERHRLLLHPLDPASMDTSTLQLALRSQHRNISENANLRIDDPDADQRHNIGPL